MHISKRVPAPPHPSKWKIGCSLTHALLTFLWHTHSFIFQALQNNEHDSTKNPIEYLPQHNYYGSTVFRSPDFSGINPHFSQPSTPRTPFRKPLSGLPFIHTPVVKPNPEFSHPATPGTPFLKPLPIWSTPNVKNTKTKDKYHLILLWMCIIILNNVR